MVLRALLLVLLTGLAALVTAPLWTDQAVGTGEAYNYSLALADGVSQLRAGEVPVLVGQTEYAFNGRVHPLRNAPYLIYLAGALDLVSLRQLSFWQLQNLSVALSLALLIFGSAWALRWSTDCPGWVAIMLTAAFVLSPAVLGAAYTLDLLMTVHATPFVVIALAAAVREFRDRAYRNDLVLALGLAAAWWAHPPVAFWTSAVAVSLRLCAVAGAGAGMSLLRLALALVAAAALAGFVFISALEVTPYSQVNDVTPGAQSGFAEATLRSIAESFPRVWQPVSRQAGEPGDVQLGYTLLTLLVVAAVGLRPRGLASRRVWWTVTLLVSAAAVLLILLLPLPGITAWLWHQIPSGVQRLTGVWPGQRFYLVAGATIVLAVATGWRARQPVSPAESARLLRWAGGTLLGIWAGWQAYPFIARGFDVRWPESETRRHHLGSNLDLTVTSYSFLGLPRTFAHGVMEPWAEFGLEPVRDGLSPISNYAQAEATGRVVSSGELVADAAGLAVGFAASGTVTLEPNRRYVLTFTWPRPVTGTLILAGPSTTRRYFLPSAGAAESFGIGEHHRAGLALSTSHPEAETIDVRLQVSDPVPQEGDTVAQFRLLEVDEAALPVQVQSLFPLRLQVTSPSEGYYVTTPRRFIGGYTASVGGRPVRVVASSSGQVMLPVLPGSSEVEVRFDGSERLHTAFWASTAGWLVMAVLVPLGFLLRRVRRRVGLLVLLTPTVAACSVLLAQAIHRPPEITRPLKAPGPLLMDVLLPQGRSGGEELLLSSGRKEAGTFLYLRYEDDAHLRVGIDNWGQAVLSEPVPIDYRQRHEIVFSAGFMYPDGDESLESLPGWLAAELKETVRVEIDGQVVLEQRLSTHPSDWENVHFGRSLIGGSYAHSRFTGTLHRLQRLPLPAAAASTDIDHLTLRWPEGRAGFTEPLLTVQRSPAPELLSVSYLPRDRLQLTYHRHNAEPIHSEVLPFQPGEEQRLSWARRNDEWQLSLDGQNVLVVPNWSDAPTLPMLFWGGLNQSTQNAVTTRFTGPELSFPPAHDETPRPGPVVLLLSFPGDRTGQAEPLLITGRAGAADALYVTYLEGGQLQLGVDHWGVGTTLSSPIAFTPDELYHLEVHLGSLYPGTDDTSWVELPEAARQHRKQTIEVRLNGEVVWSAPLTTHPAQVGELAVGRNDIGVSSCGPAFTGRIHRVHFQGLTAETR